MKTNLNFIVTQCTMEKDIQREEIFNKICDAVAFYIANNQIEITADLQYLQKVQEQLFINVQDIDSEYATKSYLVIFAIGQQENLILAEVFKYAVNKKTIEDPFEVLTYIKEKLETSIKEQTKKENTDDREEVHTNSHKEGVTNDYQEVPTNDYQEVPTNDCEGNEEPQTLLKSTLDIPFLYSKCDFTALIHFSKPSRQDSIDAFLKS